MSKGFKKRKLAIALSACLGMASGGVYALGMGEIQVNTSLNEPLDAKIKLFSATPAELDSLKVQMASQEVFSRMGLDRMPVLRDLNFELVTTGDGAPYIKVFSSKAVKEPFLDFILAVNWASGQMMREYTLLLDPPVFEQEPQVARVDAATTQPAQIVREQPAATRQPSITAPGSYGPTNRTDTLWTVAQKMRPDASVSVPQMMIALLKENPEAFEDGNINNLKAGYILRQPDMAVITALTKQQAAAESNRQYQQWQADRQAPAAPSGRQQRVAAPAPSAPAEQVASPAAAPPTASAPAEPQARLQLLSPDEEARIRSGVGSGTEGAASESLRQQLAIAQETAEATRQENADLRSRLEALEKQLQSVQKLITLRDDTLGALQADAQQAEAPQAATATAEAGAEAQPGTDAQAQDEDTAAAPPASQPASQTAQAQGSLLDEILANPTYLYAAGGGLVVLLLLVMLIMRRRRQDDEGDFTVMTPVANAAPRKAGAAEQGAVAAAAPLAAAAVASSAEAEEQEEVAIGDIGDGIGAIHAEESEIDPIAEADVYLAYRRYEQAEALLKEAIGADAERHELKLKLLEIYHATKDKESFEAQAESLYAAIGNQEPALWGQAVEMGRELLPDHPLFSEGGAVDADASEDLDRGPAGGEQDLNFDDEHHPLSADGSELSDDELAGSLGLGGLDEETQEGPASVEVDDRQQADTEAEVSLDDLGDLDLDLDLEDADALAIGETGTDQDKTSAESDLAALDLGAEGLEDLEPVEEALANDLQDLSATEQDREEEIYDLSAALDEASESEAFDLGQALEEGAEAGNKVEAEEEKTELSLADDDAGHSDVDDNPYAKVDLDAFSSAESESWKVEAAESVFHSRDVKSETDGLLDSARRAAEADNSIDMDEFSGEPEQLAEVSEASEPSAELDTAKSDESAVPDEKEAIDPLADIADLGEMDFGDLSDEDNDNIFDSSDDMIGTKLDLAKAYIDMGDQDGARSILDEVVEEGDDDQRHEAEQLMQQIS